MKRPPLLLFLCFFSTVILCTAAQEEEEQEHRAALTTITTTTKTSSSSSKFLTRRRRCNSKKDCPFKQYCAKGTCRPFGGCRGNSDCLNPNNKFQLSRKEDCGIGFLKCRLGVCTKKCNKDKSPCRTGQTLTDCPVAPCDAMKCNEPHESCVNDYCAGCNALFFNAKGQRVCKTKHTLSIKQPAKAATAKPTQRPKPKICKPADCGPKLAIDTDTKCPNGEFPSIGRCALDKKTDSCQWIINDCPTCNKDEDCRIGQFCSRGLCRTKGTCDGILDCLNPSSSNIKPFLKSACKGHVACVNNKCKTKCSSTCPVGAPPATCRVSPCSAVTCKTDGTTPPATKCVDYACGGCKAIFFNAKGDEVCGPSNIEPKQCKQTECGPKPKLEACSKGSPPRKVGQCAYSTETETCQWQVEKCKAPPAPPAAAPAAPPVRKCRPSKCGKKPVFAATKCADGTYAEIGDCIFDKERGECKWERRLCPKCQPHQCGPKPPFPSFPCPDGSLSGIGNCELNPFEGRCEWELKTCKTSSCSPSQCEPATCRNGSSPRSTGECTFNAQERRCSWTRIECDDDVVIASPKQCRESQCGPKPAFGGVLCTDGTFARIGGCEFDASRGTCEWQEISCPPCKPSQCGEKPRNTECRDGTTQTVGDCVLDPVNGICEWETKPCKSNAQDEQQSCSDLSRCGPKPTFKAKACPNGSHPSFDACGFDHKLGRCKWQFAGCKTCNQDKDCASAKGEFCSRGLCRSKGTCGNTADCFNPANKFPTTKCLGHVVCNKTTNKCERRCSGSMCPPGKREMMCPTSCRLGEKTKFNLRSSTTSTGTKKQDSCANKAVKCVDYPCGTCGQILFDQQGNQLCDTLHQ